MTTSSIRGATRGRGARTQDAQHWLLQGVYKSAEVWYSRLMINDEKTRLTITLEQFRQAKYEARASGFVFGVLVCSALFNIARALGWTA